MLIRPEIEVRDGRGRSRGERLRQRREVPFCHIYLLRRGPADLEARTPLPEGHMSARLRRAGDLDASFLLALVALSCSRAVGRTTPTPPTGYLVTAEAIQKSGAKTVWEALQLTVPVVSFRGTTQGGSRDQLRIKRRGPTSLYLNDDPRVFIDQVRIVDISVLDQMPATDVVSIRVLTGVDATTYYGTSAVNGVILISTRSGPEAKEEPPREES